MTIRHLKIFIAVYSEMSITKASQKLHLAQSSVSMVIRELEENYHVKLFDRVNRRLYVTEEGRLFFDYAAHIVDSFDQLENVMTEPDAVRQIHIGTSITIGNYLVPGAVRRFQEYYPACSVSVSVENSHQIIQKVLKNELAFGVVEDRASYEQLAEKPFMKDRLFFVCGAGHPLAGRETVTLEDVCRYPFFMREPGSAAREITEHFMKIRQMKYEILWESVSNQALLHAIRELPGITVLSEKLVEKDVKEKKISILPLHPQIFERQFSVVYHRQKYLNAAVRKLMDVITAAGQQGKG